jgi:5-methylcytosine-specific restriction protein A
MGRLTALRSRLSAPKPRLAQAPKTAEPFYQSVAWRALREQRRRDPDYREALKRAAPGERLILDHGREIKDGGDLLDPANTQWLTMSEHNAKTAKARGDRARGDIHRGVGKSLGR